MNVILSFKLCSTPTIKAKLQYNREEATSRLAGFHAGSLSCLNWYLEMLVFVEGGKQKNPEKNPLQQVENQQQTQPTYGTRPQSNPGHISTLVGGKFSHCCAIPAPPKIPKA